MSDQQTTYGGLLMIFVLYILWFIFNEKITAETAVSGLIVCAVLYFFLCRFMGYSLKKDVKALKTFPLFLKFLIHIFINIILSNISVIKIILSQKKKAESEIVTFNPSLKKFGTKCLYANSITITPGTFTIKLKDGVYTVHSLIPSFSKDLNDSVILKYIKQMEEKGN